MGNKQLSLFKTISCVNKQRFFEGKVDLKYKVKICSKDITLRDWYLISLKLLECSREYSLNGIVQIQKALLGFSN